MHKNAFSWFFFSISDDSAHVTNIPTGVVLRWNIRNMKNNLQNITPSSSNHLTTSSLYSLYIAFIRGGVHRRVMTRGSYSYFAVLPTIYLTITCRMVFIRAWAGTRPSDYGRQALAQKRVSREAIAKRRSSDQVHSSTAEMMSSTNRSHQKNLPPLSICPIHNVWVSVYVILRFVVVIVNNGFCNKRE